MPIINITIDTDRGGTLAQALAALGLPHVVSNLPDDRDLTPKVYPYTEQNVLNGKAGQPVGGVVQVDLSKIEPSETVQKLVETLNTTNQHGLTAMDGDRKRGEPGAGHRRRTNREIEEDKLYFDSIKPHVEARAHAAVAAMDQGVEKHIPDNDDAATFYERQREQALGIQTGAERVNPDDEPTPEQYAADNARAAQDAADEATESAANRGAEPTLDDLRRAVGTYQKKFGMEQAARRMKEILGAPLFEVPSKDFGVMIHKIAAATEHDQKDGAKFTPVKTEAQEKIDKVFDRVNEHQVANFSPATATRDEVNAAINAYATRYDGSLEQDKMVTTKTDVPRILERLFGAGKNSFGTVEKTPENLGRILAAVRAEIEKNTFGRAAK